jgi:hypothetical protein
VAAQGEICNAAEVSASARYLNMKTSKVPSLGLGLALLVLPFFLRRRIRVVRRVLIRARPDIVFPFINDLRNWPLWSDRGWREGLHFSHSGPPSGIGATQEWRSANHDAVLRVRSVVPNERLVYDLGLDHGKLDVEGVIALDATRHVTRVKWLLRWEGGPNPYSRYLDLFMAWKVGRRLDAALANLKRLAENMPEAGAAAG